MFYLNRELIRPLIIFHFLMFGLFLTAQEVEILGSGQIKNVLDPVDEQDVATKAYVDAVVAGSTGNYGTVVNPVSGKTWLDRNLGATTVADSSKHEASYGFLFQWGRSADGHQLRLSNTTMTQATNWLSGVGNSWDGEYIISHNNWLSTGETDMWSGPSAENNPCPSGFRIPTIAEWEQERLTWSSNDAVGAYASPLKLPMAGNRSSTDGSLGNEGVAGRYASSTASPGAISSYYLYFVASAAYNRTAIRAFGISVRCIKD